MKLYLIQHGKAKSKDEDPDRPLTGQGRAEVRKVAEFVAHRTDSQHISLYHSGKTRARETAEIVARSLPSGQDVTQAEGLKPLDDPAVWAGRVGQAGNDVMLVGHLPHLSKLAALLLCGDEEQRVVEFQNAGIVCLENQDGRDWLLRWAVTPELLV